MSPFFAEFIGTLILILLGNGVVAGALHTDSKAENAGWVVIVIGWGLAVTLAIYAVGEISGAHINPAVTIGLAVAGKFSYALVPTYIAAQISGAFVGAILVWIHYYPHWKKTSNAELKRAMFCTAPAVRCLWANFLSEALATMVLMFALLFIGVNEFTQGLNPLVIGLLIVSIGFSLGGTTGFAINPARDLGPRIAHFILPIPNKTHSDWSYAWVPILGPIVGGILGSLIFIKLFE